MGIDDSVSQKCLIQLNIKEMGCCTVFMFCFTTASMDNPNEEREIFMCP